MNTANYQFRTRPLTVVEARSLIAAIKLTSNITGYTEKEWLNFDRVIVCESSNGEFVGLAAMANISADWAEIAVIYVFEAYRNSGIGTELFNLAMNSLADKNIYVSSRNPQVIKLMENAHFWIYDNLLRLPLVVNLFNLKWIMNFYRLREGFRKRYLQRSMGGFVYGIKNCS